LVLRGGLRPTKGRGQTENHKRNRRPRWNLGLSQSK
jgi:hypothetical protein